MQFPARVINQLLVLVLFAGALCLVAPSRPATAAEKGASETLPSLSVTAGVLESKIKELETATEVQPEVKTRLVDLYRQALSKLEEVSSNAARAAAFEDATQTAPLETQKIRDEIAANRQGDPQETLALGVDAPLEQIERQLDKEKVDLAAVTARGSDFERRVTYQQNRPATISRRLAEARQQQEEIVAALGAQSRAGEGPVLSQARRWILETGYAALSNEIRMLDQELLSQRVRLGLLEAKRDQEAASADWISARIALLSELVNRKRQLVTEQARFEAEEAQREATGSLPVIVDITRQNAEITEELHAMAVRLETLDREKAQAKQLAARIAAGFKDAQNTLEAGGLTEGLGQVLIKQRELLPDFQIYSHKARERNREIAEVGVRRLRHGAEARKLADIEQAVGELLAQLDVARTPVLRNELRELLAKRSALLEKALQDDEFYLGQLRELDAAEANLLAATSGYGDFLDEHLFWLRTSDRTKLEDVRQLPKQVRELLSPEIWLHMGALFGDQVTQSPVFALVALLLFALSWKRRALIAAIVEIAERLGKPSTDRFSYTLRTIILSLLAVAPAPLFLAAVGWQLLVAEQGSDQSHAVGAALLRVALHFYFLRALAMMCIPGGLAEAHFRWPKSATRLLRVELRRLTWFFVPAALIVTLAIALLHSAGNSHILARLSYLVLSAALARFLFRVFHPRRGVLAHLRTGHETGILFLAYPLWYPLLLAAPLLTAASALGGYVYSAATESNLFLHTLAAITGLVLLHALALRWLLLTQRRLAYAAALERRRAALAARRSGEGESGDEGMGAAQFEEPEVDLAALSEASRELLNVTIIGGALVALYLIWSPLLPALRIFDDVTLWYQTVMVDGEDRRLPITVGNLGLALVYAIGSMVLVKRLPAVLEIILLHRFDMSSGSRYTVTTISSYAIIAVGLLLVLNTLGAQWSQLQWLVAALSVGIGFGLQEIVANFISGLILLFERPIRVGDIVTVGDTDGVVTKIRIRATTIRNWDRKELVVPNKEFITGRLLNWSLSDSITRAIVAVGVAYGSDVDRAM
ncbi:MAG: mechanosensitive ion channel, partial [Candidatus Accumulibacter sp.]|nr:mechanosensitive ion channel [Accumulibacter sp.]